MKQKEAGQGLVEYALVLVLVSIVVIAVMMLLGPQIGTVFSTIEGCPSFAPPSCNSTPGGKSGGSKDSTLSSLTLYAANADNGSLEDYRMFREQVFQQDENLDEVSILLTEGFDESMEVLSELADEIGDQVLYDLIVQVQEEADAGNYEAILEILSGSSSEIPADIYVALILETEPMLIASYHELQDAQVSVESFETALNEIEAIGDAEKVDQMWYLWSLVEERNAIIGEIIPGFAAAACLNADVLENTGDVGYIELAEQFKAEIGSCP